MDELTYINHLMVYNHFKFSVNDLDLLIFIPKMISFQWISLCIVEPPLCCWLSHSESQKNMDVEPEGFRAIVPQVLRSEIAPRTAYVVASVGSVIVRSD